MTDLTDLTDRHLLSSPLIYGSSMALGALGCGLTSSLRGKQRYGYIRHPSGEKRSGRLRAIGCGHEYVTQSEPAFIE